MIGAFAAEAREGAPHTVAAFGVAIPAVKCTQCDLLDQFGKCSCDPEHRRKGFVSTAQMRMLGIDFNSSFEDKQKLMWYPTEKLCIEDEIQMMGEIDRGFKRGRFGGLEGDAVPPPVPPVPAVFYAPPAPPPAVFDTPHVAEPVQLFPEPPAPPPAVFDTPHVAEPVQLFPEPPAPPAEVFDIPHVAEPAQQLFPERPAADAVNVPSNKEKERKNFRKNKELEDWFNENKSSYQTREDLKSAFMAHCQQNRRRWENWIIAQPEKFRDFDQACKHAYDLLMLAERKTISKLREETPNSSLEDQALRQTAAEAQTQKKLERDAIVAAEKAKRAALKVITPEQFQAIQKWIESIGDKKHDRQARLTTEGLAQHLEVTSDEANRIRSIFVTMAKTAEAPWVEPVPSELERKKYSSWPRRPQQKNAEATIPVPELNAEEEAKYQAARAAALAVGKQDFESDSESSDSEPESEPDDDLPVIIDPNHPMVKVLKDAGWTQQDFESKDTFLKKFRTWSKENHPDKGGDNTIFSSVSGAKDTVSALFGAFYALFGAPKRKATAAPEPTKELTPEELFEQIKIALIRVLDENPRDKRLVSSYNNLPFSNANLAGVFKMLRQKDIQNHKQPFSHPIKEEDFKNLIDKIKQDDYSEIDRLNEIFEDSYFHPSTGGIRKKREVSDDSGDGEREYEDTAELKTKRSKRSNANSIASELDKALATMDDIGGQCLNATELAQHAAALEEGTSCHISFCLIDA
jgi:hypothetical protein